MRRSRSEQLRTVEDEIRSRRRRELEILGGEANTGGHAVRRRSGWAAIAWGSAAILEAEWLYDLIGWVCDIIHPIAGWFERRRPDGPTLRF